MKKIKTLLIVVITLLLMPKIVNASGGSVTLSTNNPNVKVGDIVTVYLKVTANDGIGFCGLTVNQNGNALS